MLIVVAMKTSGGPGRVVRMRLVIRGGVVMQAWSWVGLRLAPVAVGTALLLLVRRSSLRS